MIGEMEGDEMVVKMYCIVGFDKLIVMVFYLDGLFYVFVIGMDVEGGLKDFGKFYCIIGL